MTCSECTFSYHLGQSCSGIADSTFTTMGAGKRDKWRCRTCRTGEARPNASAPRESLQAEPLDFSAQLTIVNKKLDVLLSLKESVNTLLQLPPKVDHLLALKPLVDKLTNTVEEVQKAAEFFSAKYDTLVAEVTSQGQVVKELQGEVGMLRENVSSQSAEIHRLKSELNDSEQHSRRANLEIKGVVVTPNEDLPKFVSELAIKIGLDHFQASDILAVHRLPARRDKVPDIIVKFASVGMKDSWMNGRGRLRTLHAMGSEPLLFFNENLTRVNRELFWMTRTRGKENRYKFVWVKNGRIFAKKDESHTLVRVNSVADLEKIV